MSDDIAPINFINNIC